MRLQVVNRLHNVKKNNDKRKTDMHNVITGYEKCLLNIETEKEGNRNTYTCRVLF